MVYDAKISILSQSHNIFAHFFIFYHILCHILGVVDCGSLERERGEAAASAHAKP